MGIYGGILALPKAEAESLAVAGTGAVFNAISHAHFEPDGTRSLDVDKGWQALGAALTALAGVEAAVPWGPGGHLVVAPDADPDLVRALGGAGPDDIHLLMEEFGEEALEILEGAGYGPAVLITSEELVQLADALSQASDDELQAAAEMAVSRDDIAPSMGGAPSSNVDLVAQLLRSFRSFAAAAADRGDVLIYGLT